MALSKNYLLKVKHAIEHWEYTQTFSILHEKILSEVDEGFIRIRILLCNGDVLELSEYVSGETGALVCKSYTFHWQDTHGNLRKRWDNAPHPTGFDTFPHHLHDGGQDNLLPSEPMQTEKILPLSLGCCR